MDVPLTTAMKRYVTRKVKSGQFETPEDALRAGLAKLMQHDAVERMSSEELESVYPGFALAVQRGLAEARAGKVSDGEAFFVELERADRRVKKQPRRAAG